MDINSSEENDIQEMLNENFGDYFLFHPEFFNDYNDLITNSGNAKKVGNLLVKLLFSIIQLGDIDCGTKWLEKLKSYDNMYSLHLKGKDFNYRLLFSKKSDKKLFLEAFYEQGKKGKNSYANNVSIAMKRRKDIDGKGDYYEIRK